MTLTLVEAALHPRPNQYGLRSGYMKVHCLAFEFPAKHVQGSAVLSRVARGMSFG